jgi:hypothetical protein
MIRSESTKPLADFTPARFDLFICALGYERRSSTLLELESFSAARVYCMRFPGEPVLSASYNLRVAGQRNAETVGDAKLFFRRELPRIVGELSRRVGRPLRIGVDISSMNRSMIAAALCAAFAVKDDIHDLEVFYLPAAYDGPKYEFDIRRIGAVIPELSGFDSDPSLPAGLILGVGYEYGVSLGVLNQIEPKWTLCFKPMSSDSRYDDAIRDANLGFDFGAQNVDTVDYPLSSPAATFQYLENVAFGMLSNYRVIIAPLGPKLFALIAMLVAVKHFGLISVWRVAADQEPREAVSNGSVTSIIVDVHSRIRGEGHWSLNRLFRGRQDSDLSPSRG